MAGGNFDAVLLIVALDGGTSKSAIFTNDQSGIDMFLAANGLMQVNSADNSMDYFFTGQSAGFLTKKQRVELDYLDSFVFKYNFLEALSDNRQNYFSCLHGRAQSDAII